LYMLFYFFFFFFQAEDGIRDKLVTGVQTCALPICLQLFRVPMDLGHSGAVGERLAVARNAGPVGGDHHGIGEDRSQQASVLTNGDNLPVLVSPELGEREPTRHLHGVLVLGGQGAAAPRTDECRHDSNRPQAFALHNRFLLCEGELLSSPLSLRARRSLLRRRRSAPSARRRPATRCLRRGSPCR